jgi:phage/plasmid-associated DNA primase
MDPELRDLLHAVADDRGGDGHTHVSLFGPQSRWTIRHHTQTAFWTGYCDLVDRKTNGRGWQESDPLADLCLAERPADIMPLIANLIFKFQVDDNDESWEPYNDTFLQSICHIYQDVIREYFRITSETQMELVVAVLESSNHWYEQERENGRRFMLLEVRLQFPYAKIDAGMQNQLVRPRVIQLLRNNNILSQMQRQPVNDWEQIISSDIINQPIVMYGSTPVSGRPKLKLTKIWQYISEEMIESGMSPEEINPNDAFVLQNHIHIQQQSVSISIFQGNDDVKYWLPMVLSVGYWPTVLLPRQEVNDGGRFGARLRNFTVNETQRLMGTNGARRRNNDDDNDAELAEVLVRLINPERFTIESSWLDIGKSFYTSNDGGENGILSWIRHTENAVNGLVNLPDFMVIDGSLSDTCRNLYYTFANNTLTIKTLGSYAREDSPDRYATWHREWCLSSMEHALSGLHTDVAIALYRVYWLDFVYAPQGKGKLFQFLARWYEDHQGLNLRKCISTDFYRRFEAARAALTNQTNESNDEGFRNDGEIVIKKLAVLMAKLKTTGFKTSLVTTSYEYFKNDRFLSLLDNNLSLTGVTNGILQVCGNHIVFRKAKPEDYNSMCTNNPYQSDFSFNHPLVRECMKWLGQVFTDASLLHHFLKFAASCLRGGNNDKLFPIFTGEGDNSKSMIVKLFEATLGIYCIKFSTSVLTEKPSNSGNASPQIARAKSAKMVFLDEPNSDVPMQKDTIKRFTGRDKFFARLLNENGGDIETSFVMCLICNQVPVIPNADRAIKQRTRIFPFLNTWIDDAPKEGINKDGKMYFKKDVDFDRRIPVLAPAFLWIMTNYYTHYAVDKLQDPEIVTQTTEAYWRDNDVYAQFAADSIQEVYTENGSRDTNARATLSQIYSEFKIWFRDAFPGTKVPDRSNVRTELSSRWGRMNGNSWYGIRITVNEGIADMTATLTGNKQSSLNQQKTLRLKVQERTLPDAPGIIKNNIDETLMKEISFKPIILQNQLSNLSTLIAEAKEAGLVAEMKESVIIPHIETQIQPPGTIAI